MFSIAGTPTLQLHTALYAPIIGATNNFVNSTVKTPVTDAKVSEATKNLFKVNTDNTPIIRNKLEYLFGNATGRQHNIKRSHNMALDLKGIGIMDNREAIKENLIKVYNIKKIISYGSSIWRVGKDREKTLNLFCYKRKCSYKRMVEC